jgi:hypothetical protein
MVRLTATKLKPLIFSVSGFIFSDVMNVCIFTILYDHCLLHAQFCYVIINIQYLESHVQLADQCALWKFTNGAENLVLQELQFQKVDICSKFPGAASISYYLRN